MKKFLLIAMTLFVGKVFAQCPTFTVNSLPKTNPLKSGCYTVNGDITYIGIQKAPTSAANAAGGTIKVRVEIGNGREMILVVSGPTANDVKKLASGSGLNSITFRTDGKGNNSLQSFKAAPAPAAAPPKPSMEPPHHDGPQELHPPTDNGGGL